MLEAIEQAIKPHDRYQVEVKLDYELLEGKKTHYEIATYIFIPNTLGIDPFTYTKQDFYRDIQNYIRFKTPELMLREYTEHSASPLLAIEHMITTEDWHSNPRIEDTLLSSFKFLASMLKSSLREHLNLIYRRIEEAQSGGKIPILINNLIDEFLAETQNIIEQYRSFFPEFNLPNVPEHIFAAYQLTDESISLLIEENAIEMYEIVDTHLGKKNNREEYKEALQEVVEDEIRQRKLHGYAAILDTDEDSNNELFASRSSSLKKYASSILYLDTHRRSEGRGLEQLFYALAAGISMLVATGLAFYFQQRLGNFTLPLLVALVIGYMFKDRIKEFGRSVFSNYLHNHLYDHRIVIRSPETNVKLGVLKQKMSFVAEDDVPKGVLKRRARDPMAEVETEGQREYIILHSKEIVLYKDAFRRVFASSPDIPGINDITRYDIRAYLRKMSDPIQLRTYIDDDTVKTLETHRVYRVDFLSKYKSVVPRKEKLYSRIHLIMNRDGIKRIEHLPV